MFFSSRRGGTVPGTAPDGEAAAGSAGAPAWDPKSSVAAQLAITALARFFLQSLAVNGRLQAESVFAAVGAVTGFAAHYAVRELVTSGKAKESDVFVVAQTKSGERFYFGDALNALLVPERSDSQSVLTILGATALQLGANQSAIADCHEIFARAAKTIGTPEFGAVVVPAGRTPNLAPRRAIEIFWPNVLQAFTREPVVPVPGFRRVEPRHWPLSLAVVGASLMTAMKTALAPDLAVRIFMEAAIPMSKIDQTAVQFVGTVKH
jgi:hypothetical protein